MAHFISGGGSSGAKPECEFYGSESSPWNYLKLVVVAVKPCTWRAPNFTLSHHASTPKNSIIYLSHTGKDHSYDCLYYPFVLRRTYTFTRLPKCFVSCHRTIVDSPIREPSLPKFTETEVWKRKLMLRIVLWEVDYHTF